jgi:pimeloyl-ACP methyl ester carboxylesterase
LVAGGCRVVTMDLRGHGDSTAGFPSYTPADVGRDASALLRALQAAGAGAVP